tara:strand:- start:226 stop:1335 length:1110 start_codon:yes stop_codon:yes gene_type:complete
LAGDINICRLQKKIALVGYRLNGGGAERVAATLSHFFHDTNIEVHHIIVLDDIAYSYSGSVFNLGKLKNKTNGLFNKLNRLIALKKYLNQHQFDFIIDFRFRTKPIQELLIARVFYNSKSIFTVHSSELEVYMPNQSFLTRITYANAYKIIAITKSMQEMIESKHNLKNVMTIYNPINSEEIMKLAQEKVDLDYDYVISAGRFDSNVKQFDKLIYAYAQSVLPNNNIHLVILGEGTRKNELIEVARKNGVSNLVHFLGFKNNPYKYYKQAKFYILSSMLEGMPMVLIEALSCGTPVISFDCETGPREIISDRENGLLVENQNIEKLIDAINLFETDNALYTYCKSNSTKIISKFSIKKIGKQWLKLMFD